MSFPKREGLVRIGIDLLGSDIPAEILLSSVLELAPTLVPSVHLTLLGTQDLFSWCSSPTKYSDPSGDPNCDDGR